MCRGFKPSCLDDPPEGPGVESKSGSLMDNRNHDEKKVQGSGLSGSSSRAVVREPASPRASIRAHGPLPLRSRIAQVLLFKLPLLTTPLQPNSLDSTMLDGTASRFYTTPLTTPPSRPDATPTQRRYHYLDHRPPAGVPEKATLLLLHGFPDFSEGWSAVVAPLRFAGFRLIIPDLLGYGLSSAPPTSAASTLPGSESRLAEYGGRAISIDLNGLLDHAQAAKGSEYGTEYLSSDGKNGRVIVLAHDWGSWLGWRFSHWFPKRVMGVCGLCVPFQAPTSKAIPIDMVVKSVPSFGYQKFFSEERSTKIIEEHVSTSHRMAKFVPVLCD